MRENKVTPIRGNEPADITAARELNLRIARINTEAADRREVTADDAKELAEIKDAARTLVNSLAGVKDENDRAAARAISEAAIAYVDDIEKGFVELPRAVNRASVLEAAPEIGSRGVIRVRIIELDGGREQIAKAGEDILKAIVDYIGERIEFMRREEDRRRQEDEALETAKSTPILRDVISIVEQLLVATDEQPDDATARHALNSAGQMLIVVMSVSWIDRKLPRGLNSTQLVDAIERKRKQASRVA
jgi:hypothetical protein